jgi:tetratricopeptide (TPR) repeat protein
VIASRVRWPLALAASSERLQAAILTGVVFVLYALGAAPTIYVGDSGELVAAVHTLGIPHPSGYPLYVMLGKLWTVLVPVGSIAYRMSLFSAAAAAVAVGLLYLLGRRLQLAPAAAATGALLLAVSPSFWGEANVQRVYTLNAVFVVLAVMTALAWRVSRRDATLWAAFFLCGLGATTHMSTGTAAVAVAIFAVSVEPRLLRRPWVWVGAAAALAVGLLPYLYLYVRARMGPRLNWGNPETLPALLNVVLRRGYWDRRYLEGPADLLVIYGDYLWSFGVELMWGGALLAAAGAILGFRRGWPVLLPLLVMAGNGIVLSLHGSRTDLFVWHRYYIPSYAMAALLAAWGTHLLLERLPRLRWLPALPLLLVVVGLVMGYREFDRSRYRIAEDFSRKVLHSLPPGAHLAATDDNILFVLIYLHLVESVRPDVDLIMQGGGSASLPPLRFNPDSDPLFFTHHPNWPAGELQVVPMGLTFQVIRAGRPRPPALVPEPLDGARDPRVPKDYLTENLIGYFHYMLGVTYQGIDWPRAQREFEEAARAAPHDDVLFFNLGLIYTGSGLYDEALAAFERSHAANPRHIAGPRRVHASDRAAELRRELGRLREIESRLSAGLPPPGTALHHALLAERLAAVGETAAARGHVVRVQLLTGARPIPQSGGGQEAPAHEHGASQPSR